MLSLALLPRFTSVLAEKAMPPLCHHSVVFSSTHTETQPAASKNVIHAHADIIVLQCYFVV